MPACAFPAWPVRRGISFKMRAALQTGGRKCCHHMPHSLLINWWITYNLHALPNLKSVPDCKFGHQEGPLQLQNRPPSGTTCIGSTFCHQVAPLALVQSWPPGWVTCIATLPAIDLLALSVIIGLVTSLARVTSVKSAKGVLLTDGHPDP